MEINPRNWIIAIGSGGCALSVSAFLFGAWASNVGNWHRYSLTAIAAGGGVAIVAVDRRAILLDRIRSLKTQLEQTKERLDAEYQDKAQTTQAAIEAQNKVVELDFKVQQSAVLMKGLLEQQEKDAEALAQQRHELEAARADCADRLAQMALQKATLQADLDQLRSELQSAEESIEAADRPWLYERLKANYKQQKAIWRQKSERRAQKTMEAAQTQLAQSQQEIERLQTDVDRLKQIIQQDIELRDSFEKGLDAVQQDFTQIREQERSSRTDLARMVAQYQQKVLDLEAPRLFRGGTAIDDIGNRIIKHFAESGIILDASESVMIPGGWKLKFKVDRNPDSTRLTESEFDKHCEHLGLWGLSQRPLDFVLDTRNFIVSVDLFSAPDTGKSRPATAPGAIAASMPLQPAATATQGNAPTPDPSAARFQELGCYSAAEFEEVVKLKFVPRVRVVAGSTGGKSPLLELIACAIARTQGGELWLINPIPGSPKDWFHVPGVIAPGCNGIEAAVEWLGNAHAEFKIRRDDLPGMADKPFITVMVDEINAIARDYAELGTVMKDFYQLSDHTKMGFLTAGQGGNVSGVSGGSKATAKTGNASKLMEEDFQNATQVFTAAAAKTWIKKNLKGSEATPYFDRLSVLEQLCEELNKAENKSAYPRDPASKKVSPDAYRVALVVSPREADPFFIQLPPYSSYRDRMTGITYPKTAIVTAPEAHQIELGLRPDLSNSQPEFTCDRCGHHSKRRKGSYSDGTPRYVCSDCGRVAPRLDAPIETEGTGKR